MEQIVEGIQKLDTIVHKRMKKKTVIIALILLFLIVLGIRLYFAFQTPFFSDSQSYFHLRQIENIAQTGLPLFDDPLSYGGRRYVFMPFFHYLMASFSLIFPLAWVAKVLPNALASSLVLVVYLCSFEITKRREYALFSAIVSGFIPLYFVETFNTLDVNTLSIPLSFLLLYLFSQISKGKKNVIYYFLTVLVISLITSPTILFIILSLIIFYFISKLENIKIEQEEVEVTLFSLLLGLWFYFLIFKKAFLNHGFGVIWQNIPPQLIDIFFRNVTVLDGVYAIGFVPLFAGMYVVYLYIFKKKNKFLYLIISVLLTTVTLLWLKLISFKLGMIYVSILLILFFGEAYKLFMDYLGKTKVHHCKILFTSLILILFFFTSFVPLTDLAKNKLDTTIANDEVLALMFLKENTREDQKVMAPLEEGHYISYFAGRKNVADLNFLQIKDASQVIDKIDTLFNTRSKIIANEVMTDVDAQYVFLSKNSQHVLEIDELATDDDTCFPPMLFYNGVKVYKSRCH